MNQIKIKKTDIVLLLIVIFQVFLLTNMCIANSYILHQADSQIETSKVIQDKEKNIIKSLNFGGNLLIGFLSIKQIGIVSAEEVNWYCCSETNEGAICQDIPSYDLETCDNPIPTKCEQVADCKLGCCIDETEGLCTTKSPKKKCELDSGTWDDEESCLIKTCQKGCCVLGGNTQFVTEKRCERLSSLYGFEKDFRDLKTEIECLALSANQSKGACVLDEGACRFGTESECLNMGGKFSKNNLCSKPSLNTSCEKQASIGCIEGEDEIYWFDSCGNRENIYSSDKDASWNNGELLAKDKSCNPSSPNINSEDCGNCNYFLGSRCSESGLTGKKVKDGDFICESMNCVDEDKKQRKNGESWCVYDSYIGDGKDTVGSRHWRRICIEGEIKIEPCADYRGQICVQSEIKNNETSETFLMASCVTNQATECLSYNSESNMGKNCGENKDCMIKNINVDEGFKFDVCVGRYPKGFDLTGETGINDIQRDICGMASSTCTVINQKKWHGGWECVYNCACLTDSFSTQMNDFCISLGDCGSYVNYIGKGTDNIQVINSPSVSWTQYKSYADPVKGQYAEPQDIRQILGYIGGGGSEWENDTEEAFSKAFEFLGKISGGVGGVIGGLSWLGLIDLSLGPIYGDPMVYAVLGPEVTTTAASFGAAASAFAMGITASMILTKLFGFQGDAAMIMTLGGIGAGIVAGSIAWKAGSIKVLFGMTGIYILIALIILAIIIKLLGIGEVEETKVTFVCMPWEAPLGGDDCDKCNEDKLKPCSKYKCSSLGQACKLLNENTENPVCVSIPNDNSPPIISPGEIEENYTFMKETEKRVEIRTDNGKCIPEFIFVSFSLETDEYAQCRYSFERTNNYDDMTEYFAEQNSFVKNHSSVFMMPSLESLYVYNLTGNIKEMFGNLNIYVRCQDYHGNFNLDEYAVNFCINSGPDLTAPRILATEPENKGFLSYGTTEIPLKIYLNEPANCKYDLENKEYDLMINEMNCSTGLFDSEDYGWPCSTILTNLNNSENNFYIRCKDQPWLAGTVNETKRNINTESYVYTLYGSENKLKIDSITPQGKVYRGFEPISLDLEVKTSKGINNGNSVCYYSFSGYDNMIQFFDTFSNHHKQNFNTMMRGNYNIYVKCEDDAENIDYGNSTFKLIIDSSPPTVIRIYIEGNSLRLITDEQAECYYDFEKCNFNTKNATSMTTAFSTHHSADLITGQTYHIKCIDVWGNSPNLCSIKILPNFFV